MRRLDELQPSAQSDVGLDVELPGADPHRKVAHAFAGADDAPGSPGLGLAHGFDREPVHHLAHRAVGGQQDRGCDAAARRGVVSIDRHARGLHECPEHRTELGRADRLGLVPEARLDRAQEVGKLRTHELGLDAGRPTEIRLDAVDVRRVHAVLGQFTDRGCCARAERDIGLGPRLLLDRGHDRHGS